MPDRDVGDDERGGADLLEQLCGFLPRRFADDDVERRRTQALEVLNRCVGGKRRVDPDADEIEDTHELAQVRSTSQEAYQVDRPLLDLARPPDELFDEPAEGLAIAHPEIPLKPPGLNPDDPRIGRSSLHCGVNVLADDT